MSNGLTLLTLLGLVALGGSARGHDFWLEPADFRPSPGAQVPVTLRIGSHYAPEDPPYARKRDHALQFLSVGPDGQRQPVPGEEAKSPAGHFQPTVAGPHLLVYVSAPSRIELPAEKFETYLAEEGQAHVLAARKVQGSSKAPGRERFSRSAKALLAVSGQSGQAVTKPLGLPLELVPELDPYTLRPGAELPVRLLRLGRPLADRRVAAYVRPGGPPASEARTDAEGRVRLRLPTAGRWLIKAVNVTPSEGQDVDWVSVWASLTFEVVR